MQVKYELWQNDQTDWNTFHINNVFDPHLFLKYLLTPYYELYKKELHDPDNHDGVVTHLQADIQVCEVKWALGSIITNKASGGDGFQLSYIKSWKMMLWKFCTQYAANLENSVVATGLDEVSFNSNPKERQCQRMLKLSHNYTHLTR